jgi:MEMO1 family protein
MTRRAVVAGTFYEGSRDRLGTQVMYLLTPDATPQKAIGVVVPHAGYVYSGRVAGAVFSRVAWSESWVILGPNHTGQGLPASIMTSGEWETPLGTVSVDGELAKAILRHSTVLGEDPLSHVREHSIEVQLPFLQIRGKSFCFVPISLYRHEYAVCQEVGQAVAAGIRQAGKPVVLVASTDMSHYVSRTEAAAKDRRALDAILALDPEGLHRVVSRERISMCGFHATVAMLVAAKALGATSAELVKYTDSGEVTGDTSEVVAYAGLIIR